MGQSAPTPSLLNVREVGRVEARRVAGVVHHRSANAAPRVVRTQGYRIRAADQSRIGPVEQVRTALVTHPVGFRIPERTGIERDDAPPRAGQPLRQRSAACAAAHDDDVDVVGLVVAAHVVAQLMREPGRLRQQPSRVVAGRGRRGTARGCRRLSSLRDLERLALVEAHVLVATRIRRPGKSHLVPGPWV